MDTVMWIYPILYIFPHLLWTPVGQRVYYCKHKLLNIAIQETPDPQLHLR